LHVAKFRQGAKASKKCTYSILAQETAKDRAKLWHCGKPRACLFNAYANPCYVWLQRLVLSVLLYNAVLHGTLMSD